jgi:integrase
VTTPEDNTTDHLAGRRPVVTSVVTSNPKPRKEGITMKTKKRSVWAVEGNGWVYRKPVYIHGSWRVRRRHKDSRKLQMFTLAQADSLKAAKQAVMELIQQDAEEAKAPERAKPQNATLKDAFAAWIETIQVRQTTLADYKNHALMFARLLGEDRLVSEVTYADVERLFTGEWKDLRGRSKLYRLGLLKRAFGWFVKHGYCRTNHPENVDVQQQWKKERINGRDHTGKAISHEDCSRLLAACEEGEVESMDGSKNKAAPRRGKLWWLVFIAVRSGLRLSNLIPRVGKPGLLWGHLDLEEGIIEIPAELMKNGLPFRLPMHQELAEELRRLRASLGHVPAPEEPVIGEISLLRARFEAALRRAGLMKIRLHDLRHSFMSHAGQVAPHAILQLLAHHKARTVTDSYSQHQEEDKIRRYLDMIPRLLTPAEKKGLDRAAEG